MKVSLEVKVREGTITAVATNDGVTILDNTHQTRPIELTHEQARAVEVALGKYQVATLCSGVKP